MLTGRRYGGNSVDDLSVYENVAFIRFDEAADDVEGGGFATAAGPQQRKELPLAYLQIDAVERRQRLVTDAQPAQLNCVRHSWTGPG